MKKEKFIVEGMECPSCAMRLQSLEEDLPGIKSISASYQRGSLEVEYDDTRLTPQSLAEAVKALGYTLRLNA